jgi:hypothetical protein
MPIIIKCQFVRQVLIPFKNKTTTLPYLLSQVSSLKSQVSTGGPLKSGSVVIF